ncbi:MAG TPA: amidohydrolase family protein [Verrucomicrobiae bacterium]|nr:amidohydrolase family protein [Verrucomicrobiae bacterium]
MNRTRWLKRFAICVGALCVSLSPFASAQSLLLTNAVIHTVTSGVLTNHAISIEGDRIRELPELRADFAAPAGVTVIDLKGQHVYPGIIALDTGVGLTEIEAVRATRDSSEVGDYTPDVVSWVAVNPDSELIPVARANGIAYFQPIPKGNVVAGQSALMAASGWTTEEMTFKAPAALHLTWPGMELNTSPMERTRETGKWKSLEDQAKERRSRLKSMEDFFEEAKAYAKAAAAKDNGGAVSKVPAWEAMIPYVRGELPVFVHADEVRQIRSAIGWAATNQIRIAIAGGRDAVRIADLLATNGVPVIYESIFIQPARDTDAYDLQFSAPELLRQAGVKVAFAFGSGGFANTSLRNLPYAAAHAIAFGLPQGEALKALTLHPAEIIGVADRLGSIEAGKLATLFVSDGSIFDVRSRVTRMWIGGREVSLESRHTRLYERYRNRPSP